MKPSAVSALLREHGVELRSRKGDRTVGLRDAERMTGVSRQTLSVWMRDVPAGGRNYDARTLDAVAAGLGINRRQLGLAALRDSGLLQQGVPAADVLCYLLEKMSTEQVAIVNLRAAQELASRLQTDAVREPPSEHSGHGSAASQPGI